MATFLSDVHAAYSSQTTSADKSARLVLDAFQIEFGIEDRQTASQLVQSLGTTDLTKAMRALNLTEDKSSESTERADRDKRAKQRGYHYTADRIVGSGSFGVVYQATVSETGETVAIKKVLQDPRVKNRELKILSSLSHPSLVQLKHSFYSKGDRENPNNKYLHLVMEYIPATIHRTLRSHSKARKVVLTLLTKLYVYQAARALAHIHTRGICHRDIKPQNLLLDTDTHLVKLCDFGSAKVLVRGHPNVAYICSRYYRAPELVFEATEYTTAIDMWSLGCVLAELLLGTPLFPGESAMDQQVEILRVLGTPSKAQLMAMNPNSKFRCDPCPPTPWEQVFRASRGNAVPPEAVDLVSKLLCYEPLLRLRSLALLCHPFFDELRRPDTRLPNQGPLPPTLFNFTQEEMQEASATGLLAKLVPSHLRGNFPRYFDGDGAGEEGGQG